MKLSIKAGATSVTINVFIQDSSSTTGAGLTGLVFNTSSLTAYYALTRAAPVAITLATLAAVTTAWTSGGFKELDATNMPGWYRLDVPDAALASGRFVSLHLKGAANMAPLPVEIELTGWDNSDGVRGGMTALPNAAAAAANGLPVLGANATAISFTAGMTISNAGGSALTLSSSGSNGDGLTTSGNGTGAGIKATGGATGNGVRGIGGATSGAGVRAEGTAGNSNALELAGQGTAAGLSSTGGATGPGAKFIGGGTSGDGIDITTTSGDGLNISPTTGHGIVAAGNGTSKHGVKATGGAVAGHGINCTGGGTGSGIMATSGGGATGDGIKGVAASTNGNGISGAGVGTGAGVLATAGATGHGLQAVGGATSGDGINAVATTSGHGLTTTGVGTTKHGINAAGGATTSHGIAAVGGGVGHGIAATSGGGATGDGINATSASTNGNGLATAGVGTGSGHISTGGATGPGAKFVGGSSSGDGIDVTTTAGDGISVTPTAGSAIVATANGASKHGLVVTGGTSGTSDGFKAVAGTGGVPIRGNITGNITGNLSGSAGSVTGAVGSVTGDVGGNVVGAVASVTGAVGSVTGAVGSVTAAVSVTGDLSATMKTSVQTAADAAVTANALVGAIAGYIDTEVAAIKAKTDQLVFTVANQVDVNVVDWKGAAAPAMTGDAYARLGAPAGASVSADIVAAKADTAAIKVQTDKMVFTVANQLDVNVIDWKGATAPAMTGDAFARLGAPAGASVSADIAAIKSDTAAVKTIADHVATTLQPFGSPLQYVFTADALQHAPTGSAPTAADIADAVWDEALAGHAGAGSAGAALSAAGSAGDPWAIPLPGGYGAGTAGKIVGDNLDATVSSRATQTSVDTVAGYVDTEVAAIKAKTDNLPVDPADASDVAGAFATVNATLATIASYIDTEVAAIKAKTDNLPAAPAAVSDIPTAAAVADAVLDEALSGHTTAGSAGAAISAIKAYADRTVVRGTVSATTPTTTGFTASALDPAGAAADQFKGRIIIFDNDTATAALRGQATDVTANTNASLPVFTFSALSDAPQSGDTFSIV